VDWGNYGHEGKDIEDRGGRGPCDKGSKEKIKETECISYILTDLIWDKVLS
jgi:hypothetical protein